TSPVAEEGSMQQTLHELTDFCTSLQRQHLEMLAKFQAQEVEIIKLKERVKFLEDKEGVIGDKSEDDAPIKGRRSNEGEAAAEKRIRRTTREREDLRMNEQIARDAEVARIHAEKEIQAMIGSLDKSNETVAKYLQEYQQFASYLSLEKKIELISDLVKYQYHYKKLLYYGTTDTLRVSYIVPVEDVYVQALQVKHPIIDWKVHSEGERNYW
nr:hypothetical protein [Tanacetum cinerariifolium]